MHSTISDKHLEKLINALQQGELVSLPTETVYGLAGDALNPKAVDKIYSLKQRPRNHPLIVHLGSKNPLKNWAKQIPDYVETLVKTYWPGPLTLVLEKQAHVPDSITGGQNSVALRSPDHPIAQILLNESELGLVAPSANPYGRISPSCLAHVQGYFPQGVHWVDGGPCRIGIESTIVHCLPEGIRILRPGRIHAEDIKNDCGIPIVEASEDPKPRVPGAVSQHYAPLQPCYLFSDSAELPTQQVIAVLDFEDNHPKNCKTFLMPIDADAYAALLYSRLHEASQSGVTAIWIKLSPDHEASAEILDRLQRMTHSR